MTPKFEGEKESKHRGEETTVNVNSGMKKRTNRTVRWVGDIREKKPKFGSYSSHKNSTLLLGEKLLGNRL